MLKSYLEVNLKNVEDNIRKIKNEGSAMMADSFLIQ